MKIVTSIMYFSFIVFSHACTNKEKSANTAQSVNAKPAQEQQVLLKENRTATALNLEPFDIKTNTSCFLGAGREMLFTAHIHSFPEKFEFTVTQFNRPVGPDEAFATVKKTIQANSGRRLIGVINAGFFDQSSGTPFSYFQSAPPWIPQSNWQRLPNQGTLPKPKDPGRTFSRPCLEWIGRGHPPRFFVPPANSTPNANDTSRNIMCAGPMLFDNPSPTTDLTRQLQNSADQGGFTSSAREDSADVLEFSKSQSRSASCLKANGDFLIFAQFPDQCGLSLPALQQRLLQLGCVSAMAHDGGTSVQYTFYEGPNQSKKHSTAGVAQLIQRRVPVWLAVTMLDSN